MWTNRFGDECSYEKILLRLLDTSNAGSACFGTHTPFAVTLILSADEHYSFLTRNTRASGRKYLMSVSRSLEKQQLASGAWNREWLTDGKSATGSLASDIDELLAVTGHLLEWMCRVDEPYCPNEESCRKAIRFVMLAVPDQLSDSKAALEKPKYCGVSHCCRALGLLASAANTNTKQ